MTTEASGTPQPPVMEVAEVYRLLGNLERGQTNLEAGQAELKEQLTRLEDRTNQRFDRIEGQYNQRFDRIEGQYNQRFDRIERRVDRLMFAIIGFGAAMLVAAAGYALRGLFSG